MKKMKEKSHKITLLLSKYSDPFSKLIALSSRGKFTHISISLDPEENVFFSFNRKGFITERWKGKTSRYLKPDREYIRFYVDDDVYYKLVKEIQRFDGMKHELTYSVIGTLLCMARIPSSFKKQYFCSRFIAEILRNSGAVKLKKKMNSLYLPMHFLRELKTQT